jgi:hypothetical protein
MRLALAIAAVLLGATATMAEDNLACAKFQAPMEYNACLARLGPRAGAVQAAQQPRVATTPHGAKPNPRYALPARRSAGRVRMEFTIRPRR